MKGEAAYVSWLQTQSKKRLILMLVEAKRDLSKLMEEEE
jgi:hypothetical protein